MYIEPYSVVIDDRPCACFDTYVEHSQRPFCVGEEPCDPYITSVLHPL